MVITIFFLIGVIFLTIWLIYDHRKSMKEAKRFIKEMDEFTESTKRVFKEFQSQKFEQSMKATAKALQDFQNALNEIKQQLKSENIMYDKNLNKISVGDVILFSCDAWQYAAKVYDIDNERIYHHQTSEGNGFGQRRSNNRIECERYITKI